MTSDAAALWARAFFEDPMMVWAAPRPLTREQVLPVIFRGMEHHARAVGQVLVEPGVGAVDWLPPQRYAMPLGTILESGVWRMARWPRVAWRLARHDEQAMRLGAPLWAARPSTGYLSTLGVDPAKQGQGEGSRLLRRALEAMAPQYRWCLLRTERPANLPFYRRHGFEVVAEARVPASGLMVWWFVRPLVASPPS